MRRSGPRSPEDFDAVDVLLVEDDDRDVAVDEVRAVLHELAVEAMARRAVWAGEDELSADVAPVDADPAPGGLLGRVVRRYRRSLTTVAVLAVGVAATTGVVDARQSAARAAALAATPAVLDRAATPPLEVWRVPGRVAADLDDTLLVVDGASLRAVDAATGEATWTASAAAGRAAATGRCFPVDEALRPDRAPVEDGGGPRGLVACVPHVHPGAPGGDPRAGAAVVVLDSTTGRTRHTVAADGTLLLAEPVGRDLLVAAAPGDGRVRVTRWDLATGEPRWDTVSPLPVLTGGPADVVQRRPESLTVGAFAVDLATGAALDAAAASGEPYPYEEHALPGGARATWSWRPDGTSGRGRVQAGDTGSSFMLPGPPLRPSITDGSDSGVLVVRAAGGDRLRGLDLRTGRMRWTRPYPGASALRATALVEAVLLVDDGVSVSALDVRTGEDLWRTGVDGDVTDGAALTDGQVVLLPVSDAEGDPELVARRITDGAAVWRTAAPAGTVAMSTVDRHLVAETHGSVVGLG